MSNLLKDTYSKYFFNSFSESLGEVVPAFDKKVFVKKIFDASWETKELKQRMRHITMVLYHFFPKDFSKSARIIKEIIQLLRKKGIRETSIEFMFLSDYIEIFGIDDYETSIKLFEFVTPFTSCEFAVRPFIIKYDDIMLDQMIKWSKHENHHEPCH